jgi:glycosyltransferase involved in cell wall biosynthesis
MTSRRPIRVLQVVPQLILAGAERMAVHLASRLQQNRFESSLASLFNEPVPSMHADLRNSGVKTFYLGKRLGFDLAMYQSLSSLIREIQPDIIHTHLYVLRYVLPVAIKHHTPIVHTIHNLAEKEGDRVGRILNRFAFRAGVTPVAIAAAVAASVRHRYGEDPLLIPNGVPVKLYREAKGRRSNWRRQAGFTEEDLLFVSAARLEKQKNPQLLLRAFLQATEGLPLCKLLFAGTGALTHSLQQEINKECAKDRVKLLGLQVDIASVLGSADVFVLASDFEGNPLSVMEALAAGLPVVGTAVGGVPELVHHRCSGILVPPQDATALAQAIHNLASDAAFRERLRRGAAQSAAEFDSGRMVRAYQQLYEQQVNQ